MTKEELELEVARLTMRLKAEREKTIILLDRLIDMEKQLCQSPCTSRVPYMKDNKDERVPDFE
jgi:ferredoxin-thioredoxin reductase catalytic subunit